MKIVVKKQCKIQNKMKNYVKIGINEEDCKSFGNGRKVMKLWIITPQFKLKKRTNKQTKQSTNLNHFM